MDDEDFEALIDLVARRLGEAGAGDLANPVLYMRRDLETGERELLPPQKRLTEMLAAFQRHMKVRDVATLESSLKRINQHIREGFVEGAVVMPPHGDRRATAVRLDAAPRLGEPIKRLDSLIDHLIGPRGAAS